MKNGRAHLADETVAGFLDGHLGAIERAQLEEHIDACSRCRELISALAGTPAADLDHAPPSDDEPDGAEPRLAVGQVVAERFVVERHAGSGGMAHVYRARDLTSGAAVALKALHVSGAGFARRFERAGARARGAAPGRGGALRGARDHRRRARLAGDGVARGE